GPTQARQGRYCHDAAILQVSEVRSESAESGLVLGWRARGRHLLEKGLEILGGDRRGYEVSPQAFDVLAQRIDFAQVEASRGLGLIKLLQDPVVSHHLGMRFVLNLAATF